MHIAHFDAMSKSGMISLICLLKLSGNGYDNPLIIAHVGIALPDFCLVAILSIEVEGRPINRGKKELKTK
jgi:hypothetical protein